MILAVDADGQATKVSILSPGYPIQPHHIDLKKYQPINYPRVFNAVKDQKIAFRLIKLFQQDGMWRPVTFEELIELEQQDASHPVNTTALVANYHMQFPGKIPDAHIPGMRLLQRTKDQTFVLKHDIVARLFWACPADIGQKVGHSEDSVLSHLTIDRAFDGVGRLAVKHAILDMLPIGLIQLSGVWLTRNMHRAFARYDIYTVSDLVGHTEESLLGFHGIGPVTIAQLKTVLAVYDLELGTDILTQKVPPEETGWYNQLYSETFRRRTGKGEQSPITLDILLH